LCVADLELGNVLLFPIDDKQSRLSGRDYVSQQALYVFNLLLLIILDH